MAEEINNPHNAFVVSILKQKKYAIQFLSQVLPKTISNNLDFGKLTLEDTSFISGKFKEFFSDILFQIPFKKANYWS
ncbi:MAG: Rpn family recombination-promoting nuclease/putative transposase [Leptospiraceae bacterium]|nr:Rpn family recombination-promoting nuclease/putative transposase [Leptospiraceae bacterium]MCP5495912.1 Rpn family recombination-promoting nuclease/putative transposase [Leptospiraceae bacterium]